MESLKTVPAVGLTSSLIEDVKILAQTAGREIKKIYDARGPDSASASGSGTEFGPDFFVTKKADNSPLTKADIRANEIITEGLKRLSKDLVISEEGDPALFENAPARFWLVDPLDGTRDFISKNDTFVVCIALIVNHEPVLGVIHSPVTDELWWAEKGKGAFGPTGQLQNVRTNTGELIAVGSRSIPSPRMQDFYNRLKVTKVERFGSALKFCKMAEGLYDIYPRFGPMMEWDTAAGQIIAEEAGCKVIDVHTGERLRYRKPGLKNRGFLCLRTDLEWVLELVPLLGK